MSKKENILKPIIKIEDKLFLKDFNNLDTINILFIHINISDFDKNKLENDLTNFLLFTLLSYFLSNNLQAL